MFRNRQIAEIKSKMAHVHFTSALKPFFPEIESLEIEAESIAELIEHIEKVYPGIKTFVLQDDGSIRKHVNIYIDNQLIEDEINLSDPITKTTQVHIFQALSGG